MKFLETLKDLFIGVRGFFEKTAFQIGGHDISILRVVIFLTLLLMLRKIIKQLNRSISKILERRGREARSIYAVTRLLEIFIWILGLLFLLDIIGVGVSGILTVFAALGVGIGFGLQNLINNAVGGIVLLFERPIRVGDAVEVDGRLGKVKSIGWRATLVNTLDNIEILVPNSKFLDNDLINYSFTDANMRVNVSFGVHYKSNPREVEKVALKVAEENPDVLKNPEPVVHFIEYGDSSINFVLRIWVNNPWDKFKISSALYYSLFDKFAEAGIEIPYPQRDLHLRSSDIGRLGGKDGK